MKIAITAANGQLGTAVIKALLKGLSSDNIVALARTPAKARFLADEYDIEVRPGDYNNAGDLCQSLHGVDSVLLVSGMEAPDKRIKQHRNVIIAAKQAGVQKLVYTSIQGAEENTTFSPIVQSNRQTERDIQASGLNWAIGRNGIYIEPDIEYLGHYQQAGTIANCAGAGKCGYTTRDELGDAYAHLLTHDETDGQVYNLNGEPITQKELADYINQAFATSLTYTELTPAQYKAERTAELGEFLGTVIAGIYEGIREGKLNNPSDYEQAAGRQHVSWHDYFQKLQYQQSNGNAE